MKVLMIAPLSIGVVAGGVRMQSSRTAEHLKLLDIDITTLNPWAPVEAESFDLAHLFIGSPETWQTASRVVKSGIPLVVSPVFFSRRNPSLISLKRRFEKLLSPFFNGFVSETSLKSDLFQSASLLLPNTHAEAELIQKSFDISAEKIKVVPNGVDRKFTEAGPNRFFQKFGLKSCYLFVGDAGAPRKNVLNLLKAFEKIDDNLVIIGSFMDDSYGNECKKLIQKNDRVLQVDTLPHDDPLLASAYATAHTFVLPSYFETPGIAALEAALAGCNIAITGKGGTREYFGNDAFYLNPHSVSSIRQAVLSASRQSENSELSRRILDNYSWERVAQKTLEAYQTVLNP